VSSWSFGKAVGLVVESLAHCFERLGALDELIVWAEDVVEHFEGLPAFFEYRQEVHLHIEDWPVDDADQVIEQLLEAIRRALHTLSLPNQEGLAIIQELAEMLCAQLFELLQLIARVVFLVGEDFAHV